MDWFLYDNGLRHERFKGAVVWINFGLCWVFTKKGVKIARIRIFISHILSRELLQIITGSGFKIKSNFDELQEIFNWMKQETSPVSIHIETAINLRSSPFCKKIFLEIS